MPTYTLGADDVRIILESVLIIALLLVAYYIIRLIREIIPTLRQIRRTVRELERTIQNSQEIVYNLKSITRNLDQEVQEIHEVVGAARGLVEHVQAVTTTITRPVTGLRSVLAGIGYGIKYLMRRNRDYEDEEV